LERDLFLTLQVIDMGIPLIVALNFCDEAEALGLTIDVPRLEEASRPGSGEPPRPGQGNPRSPSAIERARPGRATKEVEERVVSLLDRIDSRPEALLVLEGDEVVAARHGVEPLAERERVYLLRRERVNRIVEDAVQRPARRAGSATSSGVSAWSR